MNVISLLNLKLSASLMLTMTCYKLSFPSIYAFITRHNFHDSSSLVHTLTRSSYKEERLPTNRQSSPRENDEFCVFFPDQKRLRTKPLFSSSLSVGAEKQEEGITEKGITIEEDIAQGTTYLGIKCLSLRAGKLKGNRWDRE